MEIGSEKFEMLVDSGTKVNILTFDTFKKISHNCPQEIFDVCESPQDRLGPYAQPEPLKLICSFSAKLKVVEADKPSVNTRFVVARHGHINLLSHTTGSQMRLLDVGLQVNAVDNLAEMKLPNFEVIKLNPSPEIFPTIPGVEVEFEIDESIPPIKCLRNSVPLAMIDSTNAKLKELLERGILEKAPRSSKWMSPLRVVPKSSGQIRICVDMRAANRAIKRVNHKMPIIEETWNKISTAKFFSKIDLKDAFHHIKLGVKSRELTTFMSSFGALRYTRLLFGVSCAPEIFQKQIEIILEQHNTYVIVFMDDILVFANTKEEILERTRRVIETLSASLLTINKEKTELHVTKVDFLGHTIDNGSHKPNSDKIKTIVDFEAPSTIKELQSFLGLAGYIGSYIPNFAAKVEPLRKLLRGSNGKAIWGREQQMAFDEIKSDMAKDISRTMFDSKLSTLLYTDASPTAIGVILIQENDKGKRKIVACGSKTLTEVEKRYSQTQREALALVWGVEHFSYYLMGRKFIVRTDHQALKFIFKANPKESKRAMNRADGWALRLEPFDFDIEYVKGDDNIADPLSRINKTDENPQPFENDYEPHILANIDVKDANLSSYDEVEAVSLKKIQEETQKEIGLGDSKAAIETVYPHSEDIKSYSNILWYNGLPILPKSLRQHCLSKAHDNNHLTHSAMINIIGEKYWWPELTKDVSRYIGNCKICRKMGCINELVYMRLNEDERHNNTTHNAAVLLISNDDDESEIPQEISIKDIAKEQQKDRELHIIINDCQKGTWPENLSSNEWEKFKDELYVLNGILMKGDKFVIAKKLRHRILNLAHKAHPGIGKMYATISRSLWWPKLKQNVENFTKNCNECIRVGRPNPPEPIIPSILPNAPWQNIAIDFYSANELKSKILVIKDYYSRYLIAKPCNGDAKGTIKALKEVFSIYGYPQTMRSDNGPPFASRDFRSWAERNDIQLRFTAQASPRENGLVERAMQGITKALCIAKMENKDLNKALQEYACAYNSQPHSVTQLPPSDLMFARAVKNSFPLPNNSDELHINEEDLAQRDEISKHKSKYYQDRLTKAKESYLQEGDLVYIMDVSKMKLCPRFGPKKFEIIKKSGNQLTLKGPDNQITMRTTQYVSAALPPRKQNSQKEDIRTSQETKNLDRASTELILFPQGEDGCSKTLNKALTTD